VTRLFFHAALWTLAASLAAAEDHWAYLPPVPQTPPASDGHPVDRFLAAAHATAGLRTAELAPPRRWVERAAFTLTGLPPDPRHLRRIEASPDEATWREIIDDLLASPTYGERWARHWMDVARYADTSGYNFDQDNRYPFAYTYRDWLIAAFNQDMPYGRFVQLQIAADHLTDAPDAPELAALGFLTAGPRAGGLETIDDRVDVVTRGFLASTVSCARCHKHKTDPISMEDYYSLYSIFENTREPDDKPVIGTPANAADHETFLAEMAKLEEADRAVRQALVEQVRARTAEYLELAWLAKRERWDHGKATSEGFKRERLRPKAILRWRDFLDQTAWQDDGPQRLTEWAAAMDAAADDEAARKTLCVGLAGEMLEAPAESELARLTAGPTCPLSYGIDRIGEFMDVEDGNQRRQRLSAVSRLQAEHPGSPPRAMSLLDRDDWSPARTFRRGNPADRGDEFERQWFGFLGGGAFEPGKSPRLSLAEKIADPANPLTARVMANRVWAWHFGQPLADPGDFGPQEPEPALLALLDWLALEFTGSGGSLKELHRTLLSSRAFRLEARGDPANDAIDEANLLFWKWNRRRADFEAMRDRLLASAGSLETGRTGGRSVSLDQPASDSRRTLYAFVDRYALPTTFVSFDLPHPDHHSPQRVETTVPQQALYFLNSPMILRQANRLADELSAREQAGDADRIRGIYERLLQREPGPDELALALEWIRSADPADYEPRLSGHWEVRHAPDTGGRLGELLRFPLFVQNSWRTGPDLATAPVRWLHASAGGGHASAGHALVLRWRAQGDGEVRITGSLKRQQTGGSTLAWEIAGPDGEPLAETDFPPDSTAEIATGWVAVRSGDTLDFILRAPAGDHCGGVEWNLSVMGREDAGAGEVEVGSFAKQFPKSQTPPPAPVAGSPWADLIQMIWASNEFHFID
jgi:hypothetical protein